MPEQAKDKGKTKSPIDLPKMFLESDNCAIDYQKKHFRLLKIKISILVFVAIIGSISWGQFVFEKTFAGGVIALSLIGLLVVAVMGETRKYEKTWFNSRAIAESVKKEALLFMMKVSPYDKSLSNEQAEDHFLSTLGEIQNSQKVSCAALTEYAEGNHKQITEEMCKVRQMSIAERYTYYCSHRINDQQAWYQNKTKFNNKWESRLSFSSWILQISAVVMAVIIIFFNSTPVNPIGIITTTSASLLTWITARNYKELSLSYGLIAQRLSVLGDRKQPTSEEELAEIVTKFEQAISTEHTIWLTRRKEPV